MTNPLKITPTERALNRLLDMRRELDLLIDELAAEVEPRKQGPMVWKGLNGKTVVLKGGRK